MEENNQNTQVVENTPQVTSENKKPMGKMMLVLFLVGVLVLALAYYFINSRKSVGDKDLMTGDTTTQETWDPDADPSIDRPVVEIILTENGFSPNAITIEVGTVIVWSNQSGSLATVDSSPHPEHTDNPLLNLGELSDGDKFSLVFDTVGTYKYHNHLDPTQFGTITVVEEGDLE